MGSKENVSRFVSRLSKRNDPHFHVSRCNLFILRVHEAGLEPAQPQWPRDFKSRVSTDSTTRATWSEKRDSNPRP